MKAKPFSYFSMQSPPYDYINTIDIESIIQIDYKSNYSSTGPINCSGLLFETVQRSKI